MTVKEYTPSRADALIKLNIPEIELPINIKILWFDAVNTDHRKETITSDMHFHSFYEIHFIFSGEVSYKCNGDTVTLCENDALVIPPQTPHHCDGYSEKFLKASLAFTVDASTLPFDVNPKVCKKFSISNEIIDSVNFVLKQSEKSDFLTPRLISNKILEMLYCVCNSLGISLPESLETDADPRLLTAKRFIENNKDRIITCEDVAKECCLSRKQLSRIFKKHTNMTLTEFLIDSRVKYAKKLVLNREHSIKEISFMLGFESESSFVSFFKRHCGVPPGVFRKEFPKT